MSSAKPIAAAMLRTTTSVLMLPPEKDDEDALLPGAAVVVVVVVVVDPAVTASKLSLPVWFEQFVVVMPQTAVSWIDDAEVQRANNLTAFYRRAADAAHWRVWKSWLTEKQRQCLRQRRFVTVVTGVSQGGHGALRAAYAVPQRFSYDVVAPLCGFTTSAPDDASICARIFPPADVPLNAAQRRTRLFLLHGDNDRVVPSERSNATFTACRDAPGTVPASLLRVRDEAELLLQPHAVLHAAADADVTFVSLAETPDADDEAGQGGGHAAWKVAYANVESIFFQFVAQSFYLQS